MPKSEFCNEVRIDGLKGYAEIICRRMVEQYGIVKTDIDRGLPRLVHHQNGIPKTAPGKPNGRVERREIHAKAIELAEAEEDSNRNHLVQVGTKSFRLSMPFHSFLKQNTGFNIPWILENRSLFIRTQKKMSQIMKSVAKRGLVPGSAKFKEKLAVAIFNYIKTPKIKGGLGVVFDVFQEERQKMPAEVIKVGKATCIEFVILYIALARQLGLDVKPVEVYTAKDGRYIDHILAGVPLGNGKTLFLDLDNGIGLAPNQKWAFIPKVDLIMHDMTCRAELNTPKGDEKAAIAHKRKLLLRAKELSPHHYLLNFNLGLHEYKDMDNLEASLHYFLMSRDDNPDCPDTYYWLYIIYRRLNDQINAFNAQMQYDALEKRKNKKQKGPKIRVPLLDKFLKRLNPFLPIHENNITSR